ncbi:CBS domain-containing protein [uncultured Methanomethylovorans sp.]|uniref:CBS domain-containing protein n=1 Tax=uncultured Methanomethylovorans sp. TaxID=183759 RepID=UPI002AA8E240|nr:CBS domain-containing protein [uncultured Methanomethylovorans sp.]
MNVSDIMSSPVFMMGPDEPISHARNLMLKHKISTVVVGDGEKMIGIVSKADLSRKLAQAEPIWRRRPIDKVPVSMVMTEDPITIYPEASISQAGNLMLENNINYLVVMKKGLVGIIAGTDLVRYVSKLEEQKFGKKVHQIISDEPVRVHRHHTINHVMEEMDKNNVEEVLVVDDSENVVGLISINNIALNIMAEADGSLPTKNIKMTRRPTAGGQRAHRYIKEVPLVAEDIMSDINTTVKWDDSAIKAAKLIVEENSRILPVEKDGEIVSVVRRKDLIRIAQ